MGKRFVWGAVVMAGACAPEGASTETSLEDSFCDLLENGPGQAVDASPQEQDAPEVAIEGVRVDIRMTSGAAGDFGVVWFTPDETGTFAIGLSDDTEMIWQDENRDTVTPVAEVDGARCDALAVRYTYDLAANETYVVTFTPPAPDPLGFVWEESDDDL